MTTMGASEDTYANPDEKYYGAKYIDDLAIGRNGCWASALCWIPVFGSLVRWTQSREQFEALPEIRIFKPGMFSFRTLYDGFTLRWLNFLHEDPPGDDFDVTKTAVDEYTNTGFISALLLSIFITVFLQDVPVASDLPFIATCYRFFWLLCCFGTFLATVSSVLMLLFVNETATSTETKHFLILVDKYTAGIGRHLQFYFLEFALVFGGLPGIDCLLLMLSQ